MTIRAISRAAACALFATTALSGPAFGQAMGSGTIFKQVDDNGVDVTSGAYELELPLGKIGGSSPGALNLVEYLSGSSGYNLQAYFRRTDDGTNVSIELTFGAFEETFSGASGATSFTSDQGSGATLTKNSAQQYTYRGADGVTAIFTWPGNISYLGGTAAFCADGNESVCDLLIQNLTKPAGYGLTYSWDAGQNCRDRTLGNGEIVQDCVSYYRIDQVAGTGGWRVKLTYLNNTDPTTYNLPVPDWYKRTGATFWNGATQVGSVAIARPSSTVTQLTDLDGRIWQVTADATTGFLMSVRRPGSGSDNITLQRDSLGKVTQVVKDGVTTNYGWTDVGSTRTLTKTNALSQQTVIVSDMTKGRPSSIKDGLNHTTSFTYDGNVRLTRTTLPEGNYVNLAYDSRGNVTERRQVAKAGSGLADIVTSASFDATCANVITCNEPNTTTDARGNRTDYTYDATHGGILTVTRPAPTTGAVQPQVRYAYTQVPAGGPFMLTGMSQCQTLASCTGGADESKETVGYDSSTLLPTSLTRANGSGTLVAASTITYDSFGNRSTVDGPLSGTADTSKYRYDAMGQLLGLTLPDPDGAGSMKMRAARLSYRSDGQVSKQELGTVNSQSDADWALFAPLETVDVTFDSNSRPVQQKLSAGGTAYALTQTSYDTLGRTDCTAVRMNTAVFGSLPASACTLSTAGSFGPDRISQNVYDAAGELTQLKAGVSTSDAATERTLTYSNNGLVSSLTDGENNLTTYEYDGFDRLSKTRYPSPAKGAGTSSTTDYEQLGYDANSNVTSRRLRDGTSIAFSYDNLNRVALKNLPGSEPDVSFGYDNLDRITSASQTGNSLGYTWDALGRRTDETGPLGTTHSDYDLADRRTAITYPGSGLVVNYDYLVNGQVQKIRENGATTGVGVLATYAYDNLGNRTSTTFGNGIVQGYAFDPVSRLQTLTNDLSGTANDLTIGGASAPITYSPASQISSAPRSNDAYAWTGAVALNRAYVSNGLNQYTTAGSATFAYDARGNLTSDGTSAFCYSSENLLKSSGGTCTSPTTTLAYDPSMRLYQIAGTATARFAYDGANMLAEYNGFNVLQRQFVFDDDGQPIVWYEGFGTTDRRFLSADERGSIISVTDSSGALLGVNTYDEYGIPASANLGRFGYTGQAWLGEIGLQYSRARIYSPTLGRFLQADPSGTAGGVNLYTYALNNPIGFKDPFGLKVSCTGTHILQDTCSDVPGLSCVGECSNFGPPQDAAKENIFDASGDFSSEFGLTPDEQDCLNGGPCFSLVNENVGFGRPVQRLPESLAALLRVPVFAAEFAKEISESHMFGGGAPWEYGFWAASDPFAGYFVAGTTQAVDNWYQINIERPAIWPWQTTLFFFHIHPVGSPNGLTGLSTFPPGANDIDTANYFHIMMISFSPNGFDWYNGR